MGSSRISMPRSALQFRIFHTYLATAGAMLTCFAASLSVGPFAPDPRTPRLSSDPMAQAAITVTERPSRFNWTPSSEADVWAQPFVSQSVVAVADDDSITRWRASTTVAALDFKPWASEPLTPPAPDGELPGKPAQELAAVAPGPQPTQGNQANPDSLKTDMIQGVWAPDAGTCSARNFREGVLPAVINADGAWAGETFCLFKHKTEIDKGWRVVAECANPRERWKSNVRLILDVNRLTWTSKRGTQAYTRCGVEVRMAQTR